MSVPHPKAPSTGIPPADAPALSPQPDGAAPPLSDIGETLAPAAGAMLRPAEPTVQRIAGYEVLGELGRGGMGVVYKARQPGLRRLVALKMILHADYAGKDDRTRFEREARALADLRHEGIVGVYEVGEHEGKPFFSLEYVEGGSLDKHLAGTPLPPREAARLVQQLAEAMQVAHEAGIIHRDLKPANVLLAFSDASQKRSSQQRFCEASLNECLPKITDFGLAKKQDEAGLSVSGAVMGTPSYMAPEQAQGKVHSLDARTDVYALGAILYECLTGRPPFKAATHYDTLLQVVQEEPVSVRAFQPKMPTDLETVCLKCLQKEPAKRYATAWELADDLGRFLRGEPVQARPVGRIERGWRWCRRNPTTAGLLAGIALLLLTVAAVSAVLGRFAWHKAVEAQMQATDAREAEKAAVAAREEAKNKAEVAAQQTSRAKQAEEGQKKKADDATREAKRAQRAEQLASDRLYASRMRLAQSYWQEGNVAAAREQLAAAQDRRHTWEHRYLYTLMNHRGQRTFLGHTGVVSSVAFSPDGKRIASGSQDKTVKVWEAQTGQEALTLKGHTGVVTSVAFSPDGKRIASGSYDQTVKLWDAQTGQEQLSLKGHTGVVTSVAFSPDGKRIVSGSYDQTVKLWDAQTGQQALSLKGHTGYVYSVAFSPDGKSIVSGSGDKTVKVWDAHTGQEALTLKGHTSAVTSVCFSPDGKRLVSGSWDQTVKVWDAQTGQEALTLKGHTALVSSVAFSPDGKRLVSGSRDQTVKVWDAHTGQEALTLQGHTGWVESVAFSPDGNRIVSGSWDKTVKEWDAQTGQQALSLKGHTWHVSSVAFSPDGQRLASGSDDGTVKVWDAHTGQEALSLKGHTRAVESVAFSPDGKRIVSGSEDRTVKVWDAQTGQEALTLKGHTNRVTSVAFSPDGKRIASGSEDKTVRVWDAHTGQEVLSLKGHTSGVLSVAFSPDGKRLVSGSVDKTVKVWDAHTGQEALSLKGHTNSDTSVAFSPDGKRIVSGSGDGTVKVWDAHTGQEALTLKGHTSAVTSVCFSPDGKRLVSGSWDQTVKVWDAQTGQEALTLKGHTLPVTSVAFSPDGNRIASGSWDNTVKVWDAQTGQQALSLKGHTGVVTSVAFSPDGKRIASGSRDQTVKVWDAHTGQEALTLKGHSLGVLSVAFSPDGKRIAAWDLAGKQLTWNVTTGQRIAAADKQWLASSPRSPDGRWFALAEGNLIHLVRLPDSKAEQQQGFRWWIDPDYHWHAEQAADSWKTSDWFAAAFHLGRQLPERPWDARLHARHAYALARLGRIPQAATHYVQAALLDPQLSPWPLDPQARQRGQQAAVAGAWPRAVADFELAAHQPHAPIDAWSDLLLARAAAALKVSPLSCRELLDRFEKVSAASAPLVFFCRQVAAEPADARRLVQVAERLVAARRDASTLDLLGAALYRAGRFEEAARTLQESIKVQGKGGYVDSWIFLAMAQQRLGRGTEARSNLARFENWLKGQKFVTWQDRVRWRLLHEEARRLILTMPRSAD